VDFGWILACGFFDRKRGHVGNAVPGQPEITYGLGHVNQALRLGRLGEIGVRPLNVSTLDVGILQGGGQNDTSKTRHGRGYSIRFE